MSSEKHTPLMEQYFAIRAEYPDTLLFFQVGDFYELFFDDAKKAASFLGITLTSRGKDQGEAIPLCGVPMHAKDHYLVKLVKGGFKVAICDQLEPAQPGKLVARSVTQVLTPGTLTDSALLDEKKSSYLFSFYPGQTESALVFAELLTGQMWATMVPVDGQRIIEAELSRFFPDELLIPDNKEAREWIPFFKKSGYGATLVHASTEQTGTFLNEWLPTFSDQARAIVHDHEALRLALFYFYAYVSRNQQSALIPCNQLFIYKPDDFLIMDGATQRNLELLRNSQDGSHHSTLFSVLDGAMTPMGSRMIKKWIARPLIKKEAIIQRQEVIAHFSRDVIALQTMQQLLAPIGDIERVVGRIALGRAQPYDYGALKRVLVLVPEIYRHIEQVSGALLSLIADHLTGFDDLFSYLDRAILDELASGQIIKRGFDTAFDQMKELIVSGNDKLLALERHEQKETGISSLKVRFNNVHGYYIEITNTHKDLVPARYTRRQTLVGKERYTIPELQELAYGIERAQAQIDEREQYLFNQIKATVAQRAGQLRKLAHALAHLDALHGLAKVAYNNGYTCPMITTERDIMINEGRHPVIEAHGAAGFIPNDTALNDDQSLWIITGPNMGGKSTYMRQVALITIMAQCGSYVPAKAATLPIVDRIFTRIGAGDNLAAGKSTFLVEMEETASICVQATRHSLVILDEVGRGTSTFDGLAIAQAVIEYIYTKIGARCLFATHYHELTQLGLRYSGITPFYMASSRSNAGIVFLYTLVKGVADGSFGVEVAKLAQLPDPVIRRSQELLKELEGQQGMRIVPAQPEFSAGMAALRAENSELIERCNQLSRRLFLEEELRNLDFDNLTPRQALELLWKLKQG